MKRITVWDQICGCVWFSETWIRLTAFRRHLYLNLWFAPQDSIPCWCLPFLQLVSQYLWEKEMVVVPRGAGGLPERPPWQLALRRDCAQSSGQECLPSLQPKSTPCWNCSGSRGDSLHPQWMASSSLQSGKITDTVLLITQRDNQTAGSNQIKLLLPRHVVDARSLNGLQKSLEILMEVMCVSGCSRWWLKASLNSKAPCVIDH